MQAATVCDRAAVREVTARTPRSPRIDPRLLWFYRTWYRVPFLIPSWSREELELVWASTIHHRWAVEQRARAQLAQELRERCGFRSVVLTSSGRFAIEVALRALGRPGGEVVVPTFACSAIPDAVLRAGCRPVLADIGEDLTLAVDSVRACLTPRTIAVLVAHLSGTPARDLSALAALCHEQHVALIEDAAQSFGVRSNGGYLGSFGDFGILSFGVGKPTFSLGGGALLLRSPVLASPCERMVNEAPAPPPPRWTEITSMWNFVLQYRYRRATQPGYLAARAIARLVRAPVPAPWRGPMTELSALFQLKQVGKLDHLLTRYASNARWLMRRLADCTAVGFPQASPDCGYTKTVLELRSGDHRALAAHLLKAGIETEWSYTPLHRSPTYRAFQRVPTPYADFVWSRLLAVPTHPALGQDDMAYVADAIERFFRSPRGGRCS